MPSKPSPRDRKLGNANCTPIAPAGLQRVGVHIVKKFQTLESAISSDQRQPHYPQAAAGHGNASKLERASCPGGGAGVQEESGSLPHRRMSASAGAARPTSCRQPGDMIQTQQQYSPGTDRLSTNSRGSGSSCAMQQLSGAGHGVSPSLSSSSCLGSGDSSSEQQHLRSTAGENAHATDNEDGGSEPGGESAAGDDGALQMQPGGSRCESVPGHGPAGVGCASCFRSNGGSEEQLALEGNHGTGSNLGGDTGGERTRQLGGGSAHDEVYNADSVVQEQDSATAADWNDGAFWIPVGNDEDHILHLMSSSSGSSGCRMIQASSQLQAFGGVDGCNGADAGRHVSVASDSADSACSFLEPPMFALSSQGFCESLLNVDLKQQHQLQGSSPMIMSTMMSDMSMPCCNLDYHGHHQMQHASSASSSPDIDPDPERMSMMNMDHPWMQNIQDQWMDQGGHSTQLSSHHHSSSMLGPPCYTPESTEHHAHMSMQQQQSWSNYGNHPVAASNCSPGAPPMASYSTYGLSPLMTSLGLPAASDIIAGHGHSGTASMMQFDVGVSPGPTRSRSSSDMSGAHHGYGIYHHQLQLQPGHGHGHGEFEFMHNSGSGSSPMVRSLSTPALHSEPDRMMSGDLGRSGYIRRHSSAIKRSLSFMQSADEDADGSSPTSTSAKASRDDASNGGPGSQSSSAKAETSKAAAEATVGLKLGIGSNTKNNVTSTAGPGESAAKPAVAPASSTACLRPGIDDAAAQLSALLYTKSRTDIGNNAISQYHKLAFQNSFYNNCKLDNPSGSAISSVSSGAGMGSKNAARRRHGTATDPQSIAARTRRERFSDRIRILQSLVPNGERLDTVSMLGQTLEYVRFLQQQVWQLYNGTSSPLSPSSAHGAAGLGSVSAATNLAAQVASAESLAASFLSNMAQRQAAATAASRDPALAETTTKLAAGHSHGQGEKYWNQLAGNGSGLAPHVPTECTPVA